MNTSESANKKRSLMSTLFVGIGFFVGGSAGLALGYVIGGELAVMIGYGFGAVSGVVIAALVSREGPRSEGLAQTTEASQTESQ